MKRIFVTLLICACGIGMWADDKTRTPDLQIADNSFFDPTRKTRTEEPYKFGVEYRIEFGFAQHYQHTHRTSFPEMYLYGGQVGASFTFLLPMHFALQTGLHYSILYGKADQHWRSMTAQRVQVEVIHHKVVEHDLMIPIRVYYTVPLWKKLNLFFFTGPQLHVGLAQNDNMKLDLSERYWDGTKWVDGAKEWLESIGVPTSKYDRYADELIRANIQWDLGMGIEWDRYRLQGGYDFGLNNLVKDKTLRKEKHYLSEWGWYLTVCFRL